MRKRLLKNFHAVLWGVMMLLICSGQAFATYAKFDIPGDFPGDFRIDFLGTDFKLSGVSTSGGLSTASTIDFSVGSETTPGSGIYDVTIVPAGFQFVGFEPIANLPFDVYGAGVGYGTFNANTGDWLLDMPTLFVDKNVDPDTLSSFGLATRVDLQLGTQNIHIQGDSYNIGYDTTTATSMILDPSDLHWGDLNLVAGGLVPDPANLVLGYDMSLINTISGNYDSWAIDTNPFLGIQYEFDIYGNDPQSNAVPEPSSLLLIFSGLGGVVYLRKRK